MNHIRVLLVDDDPQIIDVARRRLQSVGFDVLVSTDGVRALDIALCGRPDVIVLDGGMHGGGGWAVARKLRETPQTIPIPLIFLTAETSETACRRAFLAGVAKYMVKPCDPLELIYAIEELVERQKVGAAT